MNNTTDYVGENTVRPVPSPIQLPVVPPIPVPFLSLLMPPEEEIPLFYRGIRLLTSPYEPHLYGIPPPQIPHARVIWLQAGLPMHAVARFLEVKLLDWACLYSLVEIEGEEIRSVRYQTSTDCLYFCSWRVFLRWMLVACDQSTGS